MAARRVARRFPTRFLLCRDDRFFPADFQRRVVRERLGIVPDEMDGGHLPVLGHPDELVQRLEAYRCEGLTSGDGSEGARQDVACSPRDWTRP